MSMFEIAYKFYEGDYVWPLQLDTIFSQLETLLNSDIDESNFKLGYKIPEFWRYDNSHLSRQLNPLKAADYAYNEPRVVINTVGLIHLRYPTNYSTTHKQIALYYSLANTTITYMWIAVNTIQNVGGSVDVLLECRQFLSTASNSNTFTTPVKLMLGINGNYWGMGTIESSGNTQTLPVDFSAINITATVDLDLIAQNVSVLEAKIANIGNDNLNSTLKTTRAIPREEMVPNAGCRIYYDAGTAKIDKSGYWKNVRSVRRSGTGLYTIVFDLPKIGSDATNDYMVMLDSVITSGGSTAYFPMLSAVTYNGYRLEVTVRIYDQNGNMADPPEGFFISVVGANYDNGF